MTPELFLQLAGPLPEAMLLLSREGKLVAANQKCGRLLCLSPTELQSRCLTEFAADEPSQVVHLLHACSRQRSPHPGSLTLKTSEGEAVPCATLGYLVEPGSETQPALLLLRCIPKLESVSKFLVLNQQIERLKKEVRLRIEVEETLRTADRRKDRFLAMLGHELRNPLNTMNNALFALRRSAEDPVKQQRAGEILERQIKQMGRIISDLLDVSRVTQGRLDLDLRRVDLARLVREIVEDQKGVFESAGLQLTCDLPEGAVWARGDAARLNQAVCNLLHNARKFTPHGGRIEVTLAENPNGKAALLRVADTGIGIAPERIPTLFETFSHDETRQDRNHGGLGLGLPLVKGLVELHGGEVEVWSDGEGRGTAVTLRLPQGEGER